MTADLYEFPSAPSPLDMSKFGWNDLGNARRLIRLVGGAFLDNGRVDTRNAQLLYLRKRGWIAFTGTHWDLEAGEDSARRWTHEVAGGLVEQGIAASFSGAAWNKFVSATGSSGASGAMLAQAQAYLTVDLDAFDPDPLALAVLNGTLRFKYAGDGAQAQFVERHDPADRITRLAEVDYDPEAAAPLFSGLMAFAQPQAEVRDYLQTVFGYCATATTKEQVFIILQGKGGDGKSTIVNAVKGVLGAYAVSAGVETFLDTGMKRASEASPDLARLAGDTRLICTAEPPRGSKLAAGQIKAFTGGGSIVARELRQGIFEFTPTGKVVLECNGRPAINDTDDGIWRRIRIILFERQIKPEDMDLDLPEKLKGEGPGILNWLIEGVLRWMAEGLKTPKRVSAAIEDYRRGANPFAQWWADRVVIDAEARTRASEFFADYKQFCEDNGHERPMSQTMFGRALGDAQVILDGKDSSGKQMRKGARLSVAAAGEDPQRGPGGSSTYGAMPRAVDPADDWGAE